MGAALVVAIIGVAVAAGTAIQQSDQQRRNANATFRHQSNIARANADNAERSAFASFDAIALRQVQEAEAAQAQIEANRRRALAAAGTARTAAVEAGGLGQSFDALLGDFARLESEFVGRTASNLESTGRQLRLQAEQARSQFAGRVIASQPSPVPRPDYLGASLRVLGTATTLIGGAVVAESQGRGPTRKR